MYTLILVIWFVGGSNGVNTQTVNIPGFISESECGQEAQKAVQKLTPTSSGVTSSYYKNEFKWTCVKIK